ncbi:MAG: Yop proteins translocation protein U [Chlamydiales bacterium]|nr:Yop proteins translocation protein U [Chlamydiales bacterium]MCH9620231.1 Yop proteins translocation protein U [Chlamydiales bacterium]MCH9623054.1 Yop proteins translocation protein U [Chlamydiales bacterium]
MEEKPFAPSKKKLKKARLRGDVPRSKLLASSLFFLGALILLRLLSPSFYRAFLSLLQFDGKISLWPVLIPLLIFFAGVFALGIFTHLVQTGFLLSWKSLKPTWPKRAPIEWTLLFVPMILCLSGFFMLAWTRPKGSWVEMDSLSQFKFVLQRCYVASLITSLALLLLGIFDWFYSKRRFMKRMGMTHFEKQEENKENEVNKRGQ